MFNSCTIRTYVLIVQDGFFINLLKTASHDFSKILF